MSGWDFQAMEDQNGLRFTWCARAPCRRLPRNALLGLRPSLFLTRPPAARRNEWPSTKVDAARIVVPIAALYTPLKHIEGMPPAMPYEPARCKGKNCPAVLHPYWCARPRARRLPSPHHARLVPKPAPPPAPP